MGEIATLALSNSSKSLVLMSVSENGILWKFLNIFTLERVFEKFCFLEPKTAFACGQKAKTNTENC